MKILFFFTAFLVLSLVGYSQYPAATTQSKWQSMPDGECTLGDCNDGLGKIEWEGILDWDHPLFMIEARNGSKYSAFFEGDFKDGHPYGDGKLSMKVYVSSTGEVASELVIEGKFNYLNSIGTMTFNALIVLAYDTWKAKGEFEVLAFKGRTILEYPDYGQFIPDARATWSGDYGAQDCYGKFIYTNGDLFTGNIFQKRIVRGAYEAKDYKAALVIEGDNSIIYNNGDTFLGTIRPHYFGVLPNSGLLPMNGKYTYANGMSYEGAFGNDGRPVDYSKISVPGYFNIDSAVSLLNDQKYELSIRVSQSLLERPGVTYSNYYNLALAQHYKKRSDEALATLDNGISAFPQDYQLSLLKGGIYVELKNYEKASLAYENSFNQSELYKTGESLIWCLFQTKNYKKIQEICPRMEAMFAKSNSYKDQVYHNWALSFYFEGNSKKALETISKVDYTSCKNESLLNDYGYFLLVEKDYGLSEKVLSRLLEINPKHQNGTLNMIELKSETGDNRGACMMMRQYMRSGAEITEEVTEQMKKVCADGR